MKGDYGYKTNLRPVSEALMNSKTCVRCGEIARSNAKFCSNCGVPLATERPNDPVLTKKTCAACGIRLTRKNRKDKTKLCYRCYVAAQNKPLIERAAAQAAERKKMEADEVLGYMDVTAGLLCFTENGILVVQAIKTAAPSEGASAAAVAGGLAFGAIGAAAATVLVGGAGSVRYRRQLKERKQHILNNLWIKDLSAAALASEEVTYSAFYDDIEDFRVSRLPALRSVTKLYELTIKKRDDKPATISIGTDPNITILLTDRGPERGDLHEAKGIELLKMLPAPFTEKVIIE